MTENEKDTEQLNLFMGINNARILNFVSVALASPRSLLASRRERHFEFGAYPCGEASYAQRLVEKRRDFEVPCLLVSIKNKCESLKSLAITEDPKILMEKSPDAL
ncbi:MAG: hypothetical protein V7L11_25805 [Nostoc sp.]|uniref:hypothetical protein n=1 Tax=Nostoc sp. TaxID=1180 RepID=UPI002FFAAF5F